MVFTLTINTDSAAFADAGVYQELERIVRLVAQNLAYASIYSTSADRVIAGESVLDINGNIVGEYHLKEQE